MKKDFSKAASFLYGKNSVLERLRHNPATIQELFISENFDHPEAIELIRKNRITCRKLGVKEFSKMRFALDAQGVIARIRQFEYVELDEIITAEPKKVVIFLLVFALHNKPPL